MRSALNDFRTWVARMGFNSKQQSQAALLIGMEGRVASSTSTGKRELTPTERLAMSAIRAGLKPWTPEYDDELLKVGQAHQDPTAA